MAITNHERVGKALELLKHGSAALHRARVQGAIRARRFGNQASRSRNDRLSGTKPIRNGMRHGLLKVMWESWNEVFRKTLGQPSAAWWASYAGTATNGRIRSHSPATTPIARSTAPDAF